MRTEAEYQLIRENIARLRIERERTFRAMMEQTSIEMSELKPLIASIDMIQRDHDLDKEIKRLENLLPCQAFINRFGIEAHEVFREKYPINKDTKVRQVRMYNRQYMHMTYKPQSLSYGPLSPIGPSPKQELINFEEWAWNRNSPHWFLAYHAEENIVFVGMQQ